MIRVSAWIALATLCGFQAAAQNCPPGELRIIVHDSLGGPVFDAQVSIGDSVAEARAILMTPAMGMVSFEKLPCGTTAFHVSKEGFQDRAGTVEIGKQPVVEVIVSLDPEINRSSVEVNEKAPPVQQSASQTTELRPAEVKSLPTNPGTVSEALPLVPGIVRSPDGELKINGSGEQRSSLVVNQTDVTDPATGKFGQTVPLDSIETVTVLNTPFLAQYGRFTQTIIAIETKRGGEKWHADLNDPFPDFRVRSYHVQGIRNETPRGVLGGPLIPNRLYAITSLLYFLDKSPSRTLPYPRNESKMERFNSFTQIDYIASQRQIINFTLHVSPEHTNFVNPEYFNPQPVTPSYKQQNHIGTLADHLGLFGGTLDSSVSMQRFHTFIGSQGSADMVLTPTGNRGNYFGVQTRDAWRREWLEIWAPAPVRLVGTHQAKVGTSLTVVNDHGEFTYRPVNILGARGELLQRIDFRNQGPYKRTDLEFTGYVQDHWSLNSKLSLDYGLRLEHQRLASSLRLAPRAGLAWSPFSDGRTVFRTGYGEFYDHIPTDVYAFSRYPIRTITNYAADGSILGMPLAFTNVIGDAAGPRSFLINGQRVAGAFSPRGATWNIQVEHAFARLLRLRATYSDIRSVGLIVLEPDVLGTTNEVVLNGNGASRYRQGELTAKVRMGDQELVASYTRSRAEGSQNSFDNFVGNYPTAVFRNNVYSNLPGDLPNRFLIWGQVGLPFWNVKLSPIVEYRNGFAYTAYDALQNYVGAPNSDATRFPNFFSADARVRRDFKLTPKYTIGLSLSGFNLTNHFNALAIHSNVADPQYGVFFGNYHRRYRFDFDFLF